MSEVALDQMATAEPGAFAETAVVDDRTPWINFHGKTGKILVNGVEFDSLRWTLLTESRGREYRAEPYSPDRPSSVVCRSFDGDLGSGLEAGSDRYPSPEKQNSAGQWLCLSCVRSAENFPGQKCRKLRRMTVVNQEDKGVFLLKVRGMALSRWIDFTSNRFGPFRKERHLPTYAFVLGTTMVAERDFFVPEFKLLAGLNPDEIGKLGEVASARLQLMAPKTERDDITERTAGVIEATVDGDIPF